MMMLLHSSSIQKILPDARRGVGDYGGPHSLLMEFLRPDPADDRIPAAFAPHLQQTGEQQRPADPPALEGVQHTDGTKESKRDVS